MTNGKFAPCPDHTRPGLVPGFVFLYVRNRPTLLFPFS